MGELLAAQLCYLAARLFGETPDPVKLNPFPRRRPPVPKSAARLEFENDLAWAAIDAYFGG